MNEYCFDALLKGYINNNLSREELSLFLQLLRQEDYQKQCNLAIEQLLYEQTTLPLNEVDKAAAFKNIVSNQEETGSDLPAVYNFNRKKKSISWQLAAASIIVLMLF